jgi:hypothetical protein
LGDGKYTFSVNLKIAIESGNVPTKAINDAVKTAIRSPLMYRPFGKGPLGIKILQVIQQQRPEDIARGLVNKFMEVSLI